MALRRRHHPARDRALRPCARTAKQSGGRADASRDRVASGNGCSSGFPRSTGALPREGRGAQRAGPCPTTTSPTSPRAPHERPPTSPQRPSVTTPHGRMVRRNGPATQPRRSRRGQAPPDLRCRRPALALSTTRGNGNDITQLLPPLDAIPPIRGRRGP